MTDQQQSTTTVPTIFNFNNFEIREITDAHGEPWFVVRDVCDFLGLDNVGMAIIKVPEHHLTSIRLMSGGQEREMKVVDEPGLYRLVLRSDKPEAEPFMEWVTSEVLPAIRKTGSFGAAAIPPDHQLIHNDEYIELLKAKIALLEHGKRKRPHRPLTEENKAEIIAMVASGMTMTEVSKVTQRSTATVSYLVGNKLREAQS